MKCENKIPIYLDPFTDIGFKTLFVDPQNKPLLVDFLNAMLTWLHEPPLFDLDYLPTEHFGFDAEHKKVAQDLECISTDGRHFIMEMQQAIESDFRDRMAFYAFRASIENVHAGQRYALRCAYTIVIMDGILRPKEQHFLHRATLRFEDSSEVFIHSPTLLFIEIPKVPAQIEAPQTRLDWWMCCLAHMPEWSEPPCMLKQDPIFRNLFCAAEFARFTAEEKKLYLKKLDARRGMKYALEYQWQKGIEEGIEKGFERGLYLEKMNIIESMLAKGCDWQFIQDITHLGSADFAELKQKYREVAGRSSVAN